MKHESALPLPTFLLYAYFVVGDDEPGVERSVGQSLVFVAEGLPYLPIAGGSPRLHEGKGHWDDPAPVPPLDDVELKYKVQYVALASLKKIPVHLLGMDLYVKIWYI
jgi:hypothetical protein